MASAVADPAGAAPAEDLHKPMTPPTSEEGDKVKAEHSSSELSDLDLDDPEDDTEIEPDHYFDGGKIPVFKPTMDQFRSFEKFVAKIDHYGMKAGIVKVVPPKEWIDALPALDESVKTIKINRPITQEFSGCGGMHGTFTQANIEKQRSYNLPQWKSLTEEPQHQPPARRGERRRNHEKATKPASAPRPKPSADSSAEPPQKKRKPGRPRRGQAQSSKAELETNDGDDSMQVPPTPTSPNTQPTLASKPKSKRTASPKPKGRTATTVAERRKYNQQVTADEVDEEAFESFDYRFPEKDEFTLERCQELETLYWKSLTYAPPMYGADMPGSLFEENCTSWNVAKLPNLLDVLGTKVPGVNTAYLYLGMWKATYAWHLEDVDLYSINYIHFGAPKQWYSISQEDARKFEAAMRDVWPDDAKHCGQFLRHKTYLISPSLLKSKYNITVNRLVHNEGEFVITFPYGYHSGYNLGYNCAESVNFATEAWLDYGRIAKKCDCEADSVWVNVAEIERKLRGEATPEYYEETDDEGDGLEYGLADLPTPPQSVSGKAKGQAGKRKKGGAAALPVPQQKKKIKIRLKKPAHEPCVLCPNDIPSLKLLRTDTGKQAHELCAQQTKEITIETDETGARVVCGVADLPKGRLDLKCNFCRSKKGACFQCSETKCCRAYHPTCAAPAGVRVDFGKTPVYHGDDGTEYYQELYDFRCRYHRVKRPKGLNTDTLEQNPAIKRYLNNCATGDIVQAQHIGRDIFAGAIVEKRPSEQTVLLRVVPEGDEIEVEYKWILAPALEESKRPKASVDAKPLPPELTKLLDEPNGQGRGPPRPDDHFTENCTWAEFVCERIPKNPAQVKVNLDSPNQLWHYLGRTSTEAKAQFTDDVEQPKHNPAGDFLATVRLAARYSHGPLRPQNASPLGTNYHALNGACAAPLPRPLDQSRPFAGSTVSKPYNYKPKMAVSPANAYSPALTSRLASPASGQPWSAQAPSMQASPSGGPGSPVVGRFGVNTAIAANGRLPQASPTTATAAQRRPSTSSLMSASANSPAVKTEETAASTDATPPSVDRPAVSRAGPLDLLQDAEYLNRIQKFPYLKNALFRRPRQYCSPYPSRGPEFSKEYAAKLGIEVPQYKKAQQAGSRPSTGHASSLSIHNAIQHPGKPKPQCFFPFSSNTQVYQQPAPSNFPTPPTLHKSSSSMNSNSGFAPNGQAQRPVKLEPIDTQQGPRLADGMFSQFINADFQASVSPAPMSMPSNAVTVNAMSPTMMANGDVSLPQMRGAL